MTTIAFKTTLEQEAFIRQEAAARKTSMSAFIRRAIDAMQPKHGCKITGRPGRVVIVPPPGTPMTTDADLQAEDEEYYQN